MDTKRSNVCQNTKYGYTHKMVQWVEYWGNRSTFFIKKQKFVEEKNMVVLSSISYQS